MLRFILTLIIIYNFLITLHSRVFIHQFNDSHHQMTSVSALLFSNANLKVLNRFDQFHVTTYPL